MWLDFPIVFYCWADSCGSLTDIINKTLQSIVQLLSVITAALRYEVFCWQPELCCGWAVTGVHLLYWLPGLCCGWVVTGVPLLHWLPGLLWLRVMCFVDSQDCVVIKCVLLMTSRTVLWLNVMCFVDCHYVRTILWLNGMLVFVICWLPLCQDYPVIEMYTCVLLVATMSGLSCDWEVYLCFVGCHYVRTILWLRGMLVFCWLPGTWTQVGQVTDGRAVFGRCFRLLVNLSFPLLLFP